METVARAGGAGYPPEHFDGAAGATTTNGKHMRREYDMLALEASNIGQASVGPATVEDGHVATTHRAGQIQDNGGDEKPRRASATQEETDGRETKERPSPERSPAPNTSGRQGG